MKNVELIGTKREAKGTSRAQDVRRNKQVPCVLYGGADVLHFSVDERALGKIIHSPLAHRVELNIDGEKRVAILQDKQFQPVTDAVIHADFMETLPGKESLVDMSVRLSGQSVGVRMGGVLTQTRRKLRVRGLADALPEVIEVDVTTMEVGETIRVSDLELSGITVLEKPNDVVVSVKAPKKVVETTAEPATATAAAAAAAPAAAAEAKPAEAKK